MNFASNFAFIDDPYGESSVKIRCMESLIKQIKKDHADLNRLWERYNNDKITDSDTDPILEKIGWIKKGLFRLKGLVKDEIEGVSWGNMEQIEVDIDSKFEEIKIKLRFVSLGKRT
jgi:hypothetical protein